MSSSKPGRCPLFLLGVLAALSPRAAAAAPWPALDEAVTHARARAPQVVAAQGQVGVARSASVKAGMLPLGNPYVQVFADRQHLAPGPFMQPAPATYVQPEVYIPISPPGQRGARLEEAGRLLEWKQGELRDASARAVGEVVAAYGEAVLSLLRVEEATRALALAREEADIMRERVDLQDATVLDAQLQLAEVARYVQARAEAQFHFLQARARLCALTGLADLEPPALTSLPLPTPRKAWSPAQLSNGVGQGPLIQALAAEESFWASARTRAAADALPPITLILWGSRGDQGDLRMGGGVGFTLPVVDRNQGEIARVRAERSRAVADREVAQGVLAARVLAAHETLVTLRSAVESLDHEGLPAAEAVVAATQASFLAGKLERVRVVMARRDLIQARDRRLQLIEDGWRAYGEMAAILGELP